MGKKLLSKEGVCIRIPRESLDDRTLFNLNNLVMNKNHLLKMALGADCLDINIQKYYIDFPWFHEEVRKEDIDIAFLVITHLIQLAENCHHIAAIGDNGRTVYNKNDCEEFLSQLGLIGDPFLEIRKRICSHFS